MSADPIESRFSFPRLFVEGYSSACDVELSNTTPSLIQDLHLEFESGGVAKKGLRIEDLDGAGAIKRTTELRAIKAGSWGLTVKISFKRDGGKYSYVGDVKPCGESNLSILERPSSQSANVDIQRIVAPYKSQIEVRQPTSVNDLLSSKSANTGFFPIQLRAVQMKNPPLVTARTDAPPRRSNDPVPISKGPGLWKQIGVKSCWLWSLPISQGAWKEVLSEPFDEFLTRCDPEFAAGHLGLYRDDMPVFGITHAEAMEFCEAFTYLCEREGADEGILYRLPTRHEWLKARGPKPGVDFGDYCYNEALPNRPRAAVLSLIEIQELTLPNEFGLYGMFGYLFDRCGLEAEGSSSPSAKRPLMGGSWYGKDLLACRSDAPVMEHPDERSSRNGFRLVAVKHRKS